MTARKSHHAEHSGQQQVQGDAQNKAAPLVLK
jgi:hypothetical protein